MVLFRLFGPPNVERLKAESNAKGLIKALGYKKDFTIRQAAAQALVEMGHGRDIIEASQKMDYAYAEGLLLVALKDKDGEVRKDATEALVNLSEGNKQVYERSVSGDSSDLGALVELLYRDARLRGMLAAISESLNKDYLSLNHYLGEYLVSRLRRHSIADRISQPSGEDYERLINTISRFIGNFRDVKKIAETLDEVVSVQYAPEERHWETEEVETGRSHPAQVEAGWPKPGRDDNRGGPYIEYEMVPEYEYKQVEVVDKPSEISISCDFAKLEQIMSLIYSS